MNTMLQYLRSKTLVFGLLLTIASAVQVFVPFLPQEYVGIAGSIIGAIIIILRFVTSVPLSEK